VFNRTKRIASILAIVVVVASSASAASNTTINGYKSYSNLQNIKLSKDIVLHKGDVKAVFAGGNGEDIQKQLNDIGIFNSEVYQILYKNQNVVKYGAVADVHLGYVGLSTLGIERDAHSGLQKKSPSLLPALADLVNSSGNNQMTPYTVVKPIVVQPNGTYAGVLSTENIVASVPYKEILHITLYDNKYYGTAARVVVVNAADDQLLWPVLEGLMKVK